MKTLVAAVMLLGACATPYQQKGFRGGYEERSLGANRWLINVEVNSYSSRSLAVEYTYRRAAELCPAGFDPIDADRSTKSVYIPNGQGGFIADKPTAILVVECRPYDRPPPPMAPIREVAPAVDTERACFRKVSRRGGSPVDDCAASMELCQRKLAALGQMWTSLSDCTPL